MVEVRRPKCSLCSKEAVVTLPYAKLRLCKDHFEEFLIKRVKRIKLPKRILVATSGGKDSLTMIYLLSKLKERGEIEDLKSVTVDTVPKYTTLEAKVSAKYSQELGIEHVTVHAFDVYGFTALHYRELKRKPCGLCSLIRNHAINLVGTRLGYRYVSTGHNLDDMLQVGLTSLLSSDIENLRKITAIEEPLPGALGRVKPLFWIYERDVLAFAINKRLEWIKERCPLYDVGILFADRIRNFMHEIEVEHPSIKLRTLRNLQRLGESIKLEKDLESIKRCKYCGSISYGDICPACHLRRKARELGLRIAELEPTIDYLSKDGNIPIIGQGFVTWSFVEANRWITVDKLLKKLGLNREVAVVMERDSHTTIPYDAYVRGFEKGELVIYLITRVSLNRKVAKLR
ncbi:hypothetical protein EYM_07570 [Ignicoccus islandicus DSM 13165]|uniref:Uncharacterized protein n=1 Tax=Ignicoccus islandicus DSM 13165 TaxID=940295 RepID=A0A0U2U9V2_9CREN|nr:ATP-binding protein [Ignicoccus islandicus]ALU12788.1 hypothetical protein EYM_07570 [Ignicoccus islandicus DSM 13165]